MEKVPTALIDFNKTIITLSASILSALIGYIIYKDIELNIYVLISVSIFILSILISLFGFGRSIESIIGKSDVYNSIILLSNISAYVLISGIVFTLFALRDKKENKLNEVLINIESSTSSTGKQLSPKYLKSLNFDSNKYSIVFQKDSLSTIVLYDISENKIISINSNK